MVALSEATFAGATGSARKEMWKRQYHSPRVIKLDEAQPPSLISLPNGDQIHDINRLYRSRFKKSEQRNSHKFKMIARARHGSSPGGSRQPLDPAYRLFLKMNTIPDALYDTDCGDKKTIGRGVADGRNPSKAAFNSARNRFTSTAAYRSSTFAQVVKEPYRDAASVGPGTYRSKKRTFFVKRTHMPTSGYASRTPRFEETSARISSILAMESGARAQQAASRSARAPPLPPRHSPGPLLSASPRFKSASFPERYASSKEYHCIKSTPDRFYDTSPSCKLSIDAAIKSSSCKYSSMHSNYSRLSSPTAMVHNTPNFPILSSATKESVGPGAYSPPNSPTRPPTRKSYNYVMMPQQKDRFGLDTTSTGFVEARFRRFTVRDA